MAQIQKFIVVRTKVGYCLCLPITIYEGQPGFNPDGHAPLVVNRQAVRLHPRERAFKKGEISVILETASVELHPFSRIDISRVFTISYKAAVKTVGRVDPGYLPRLEEHLWDGNRLVAAEKNE